MTKSKALKLLNAQRAKLIDRNHYKDEIWVAQTISYVKDIFGEDSVEYHIANQFKFYVLSSPYKTPEDALKEIDQKKSDILKFIDSWIETVNHKGVKVKSNFLYRLNDNWLTFIIGTIITVIFPTIFYIGFWFGSHDSLPKLTDQKNQQKSATQTSDNKNIRR